MPGLFFSSSCFNSENSLMYFCTEVMPFVWYLGKMTGGALMANGIWQFGELWLYSIVSGHIYRQLCIRESFFKTFNTDVDSTQEVVFWLTVSELLLNNYALLIRVGLYCNHFVLSSIQSSICHIVLKQISHLPLEGMVIYFVYWFCMMDLYHVSPFQVPWLSTALYLFIVGISRMNQK